MAPAKKATKATAKRLSAKKAAKRPIKKKPYTTQEAMEILDVNQSTLYRFMTEGRFEWAKVGRYREVDRATFDAFAKGYTKWSPS